jgi:hypothetical protein
MMRIFISGSIRITALDPDVKDRLRRLMADNAEFLVGDAPGVDQAAQDYLYRAGYLAVTVYCTGAVSRNNLGQWPMINVESKSRPGSREYFTAKDEKMTVDCDSGLLIWDGKSVGTRRNTIALVRAQKLAVIYLAPIKEFYEIRSTEDFEQIVLNRR